MKRRYLEQEQEEMVTVKIPLESLRTKFPEIYNQKEKEKSQKETIKSIKYKE